MWKIVVAGTAALTLAGATLAFAQQRPAEPEPFQRWQPSAEDAGAFTDARVAGLKAGLKLTAEQEKHWPPVERAIRDAAKERFDRFSARRAAPPLIDPIARLRQRADAMSGMANTLKRLADAAAPLYQSLDDAQKRRFVMLARAMRPGRAGPGFRRPQGDGQPARP